MYAYQKRPDPAEKQSRPFDSPQLETNREGAKGHDEKS